MNSKYTCISEFIREIFETLKNNSSVNAHLRAYVSGFGDDIFSPDGTILFCYIYLVEVTFE